MPFTKKRDWAPVKDDELMISVWTKSYATGYYMIYDSSSSTTRYYHRCLEYTLPAFAGISVLAQ